jgi:acyl carrier protein
MDSNDVEVTIRQILGKHARLAVDVETLSPSDDLYVAGMTSHSSINVMLALEDEFDVEFPEEKLSKGTFSSIANIRDELLQIVVS